MNKYHKLIKNSWIFTIANLGSHLISFFLVRLYTEVLSTNEYGIIDVILTTSSFAIPLISLSIAEAVLRFSINNDDPKDVLLNGLFVSFCGSLLLIILCPCLTLLNIIPKEYLVYLIAYVFLTCIDNVLSQFARGIGRVKLFAIVGVIRTLVLTTSNITLLLGLKMGTKGYLLSLILSEFISILILMVMTKAYRAVSLHPQKKLLGEMIRYSLPLLPNSILWWVMSAADRYAILWMLGASYNGLYAVAQKIPSLINICNNLFFQAWQLSAVEESNSEGKTVFYSKVFDSLSAVLLVAGAFLLAFLKPMMSVLSSAEFSSTWLYSPFLIIGMVFSAFSSFLGTNYVAMKKTSGALKTTIVGCVLNIIMNFVMIQMIGMNGAALATMTSFAVTWVYRIIDTRRFVEIKYNWVRLLASLSLLFIQSIIIVCKWDGYYYTGLIIAALVLLINYREMKEIIQMIFRMIKLVLIRNKARS